MPKKNGTDPTQGNEVKAREIETLQRQVAELEKFKVIAEESLAGIYLLQEGRFKYVNKRFAKIHGYTVKELVEKKGPPETALPEDLPTVEENIRRRVSGETKALHFQFRIVRKDGAIRNVEVHGSHIIYKGKPAIIGTLLDITERMVVEETIRTLNLELNRRVADLDAANEELRALSYSMSHDLRTPLLVVEGFSRKILDTCASELNPRCIEYMTTINKSSAHMGTLINDLLVFFSSGRKEIDAVPMDVKEMVEEVFAELQAFHPGREMRLRLGPLPTIWGDKTMMRQVLANLLSNAVKYSRAADVLTIEVGCQFEAGTQICHVRDNGIGFPMDKADKLFRVFSRLHPGPEFEGTGIGLAIAKRVIERHGGKIWAESKPDQGSTFYFSIPDPEGRAGSWGKQR